MTPDEKLRHDSDTSWRNFKILMGVYCTGVLGFMIWAGNEIYQSEASHKCNKSPEVKKYVQDCIKRNTPKP